MIDLHTHVLPGVDDGPPTLDLAVELARLAAGSGVKTIVATPHVSPRYRRTSAEISAAVEVLRAALRSEGVDVAIVPGAEVDLITALDLDDAELTALRLGGGPHLLVESPLSAGAGDFDPMLADIRRRGHQVVLAHPERCPAFQHAPERIERLVEQGFLCSITAGSIGGRFGGTVRRFTLELIARGWVHNVSSDMHDAVRRRRDCSTTSRPRNASCRIGRPERLVHAGRPGGDPRRRTTRPAAGPAAAAAALVATRQARLDGSGAAVRLVAVVVGLRAAAQPVGDDPEHRCVEALELGGQPSRGVTGGGAEPADDQHAVDAPDQRDQRPTPTAAAACR